MAKVDKLKPLLETLDREAKFWIKTAVSKQVTIGSQDYGFALGANYAFEYIRREIRDLVG